MRVITRAGALGYNACCITRAPFTADNYNWRGRLLDNASQIRTVLSPGAPGSIVSDGAGGLLIGDMGSHTVRRARVTSGGYAVSIIAGNGTAGFRGDGGFASAALLYQPFGVAPDGSGGVYVADYANCAVRRIFATGNITTVVGAGPPIPGQTAGYCGNSGVGGPGTSARIGGPRTIVSDTFGGAIFR